MDLNEFVANFAEQFDETDASQIKASTVFKDLDEWTSLIALSVIAMIDAEYSVAVKGNDIRESVTIEDLYQQSKSVERLGEWHYFLLTT